jgi:hypothetical protein
MIPPPLLEPANLALREFGYPALGDEWPCSDDTLTPTESPWAQSPVLAREVPPRGRAPQRR